ncbi:uncharacterized protein LOC132713929 isoform X2 [Ruditapes philippinarum]|uniref:uncharacterized protein LOC132713929 isoform X2 n=1 Tax=Ruditapes philippinarum TaxID=129788 RepID=UPI00295ADA0E|nr:uncharacterized protein LOC132713929 isoform X2 [Ruditapes philippinarum]
MKAGLDEHYDEIKLDIIKRKQEDLLCLASNTAERMTQIQDKTEDSVKRLHDERDKAIDTLRKQGDKEQTDLAELGKTLQEKLKTASKAEKDKQYIDSLQKKPYTLNTRRKKQSTKRPFIEINHLSIGTFVFNHTSHKMEQNVPKPEKAKLFESYYSEFSAKEEECHQFASTWGFNAKSPRGNFIDTRDCSPITESVFESIVKVEASRSVCMICFPGGGRATGFRVGPRYIMTANHVVDHILGFGQKGNTQTCFSALNSAEVYARFEFIKDGPITEHQIFRFKAAVHFRDNETDCAILELEEKCNGTEIPRSFKYFCLTRLNKKFSLIGHPLGNAMEFNHVDKIIDIESEETKRDIIEVKQRSLKHSGKDYDMPPHNILNNPKRFLFHCKFTKGASGSPGVVTCSDGRIVVVTMLLCGLPDWYYDSNVDANVRSQWPKDHCVEQGVNLKYVYEKMYQCNKSLCNQIFHDDDESKSN